MYVSLEESPFIFSHCWKILAKCPKWVQIDSTTNSKKGKRSSRMFLFWTAHPAAAMMIYRVPEDVKKIKNDANLDTMDAAAIQKMGCVSVARKKTHFVRITCS